MEEGGAILVLRVFAGAKRIIEESLILFVTIVFIVEENLCLFTLLETGSSSQFCFGRSY